MQILWLAVCLTYGFGLLKKQSRFAKKKKKKNITIRNNF